VNEPEPVLRITRQRGELARSFQTEYRAEQTQAVEKLDGFGIIHSKLKNSLWILADVKVLCHFLLDREFLQTQSQMVNLIPLLIGLALLGGWIYLLKYVYTKAREQNVEGEEFRTGRPPAWRIVLYCLIVIAIPLYFSYPKLKELQPQIKILLAATILILPVFIVFIGVILPAIVKKKKAWLMEHKTLILRLLYVVVILSALLKLWNIFHK
jgi:hypothetical protein